MQFFSQYTLGIDIKNDSAAIVSLQSSAKGYKLAGHEIFALDPNIPITEKIGLLGRLVNNFIAEHKLDEAEVLISVPGKKTIIREISFPLSVRENLRETMRYEVEKYVPFSANDIYFDCQITNVDKKNNTLSVLLVVAKKDDLDPYLALQTEIGTMSSLETGSTIMAFGVGAENSVQWPAGTGILINLEEERLHCNLIKGQHLLLTQLVHPEDDDQEPGTRLREAIESICSKRDMGAALESIYYFDEGSSPQFAAPWVAALKLKPLPLPDMLPAANLLTAYFLALKGQQKPDGLTNLIPEKIRRRPTRTSMYITATLTILIVLLSFGLAGNFFFQKKMINKQLMVEMTRLNREVEGLPQMQEEIASLQNRISYLVNTAQQTTVMLDIINELSQLIPDTAWIEKFDFSKNYVRVDGSAESASALIEKLESSYLFKDVSFLTPVRKDRDNREQFSIGCTITRSEQ